MSPATHRHEGGPRAKRGLPRPCMACGQSFRPKNNKGKFCSEACRKARLRLEAKTGFAGNLDTYVARVPFRSKSSNENNNLQGQNRKPRVNTKSGWHVEAGELVFYPLPSAPSLTAGEAHRLSRGHMRVAA